MATPTTQGWLLHDLRRSVGRPIRVALQRMLGQAAIAEHAIQAAKWNPGAILRSVRNGAEAGLEEERVWIMRGVRGL